MTNKQTPSMNIFNPYSHLFDFFFLKRDGDTCTVTMYVLIHVVDKQSGKNKNQLVSHQL